MRTPPRDEIDIAGEGSRRDAPAEPAPAPAPAVKDDPSPASAMSDPACPVPAPALAAVAEILCYLFRIDREGREDPRINMEGQAE